MRVFLVEEVHRADISCLHWSRNAMRLFSGDADGRVVCTEIDYVKVSPTRLLVSLHLVTVFVYALKIQTVCCY